jgi:hypothetical protein
MTEGETRPASALWRTQQLFFRAITWPRGVSDFLRSQDSATRAEFDATFASSAAFPRAARVEVYANAYFYRLLGVLREQFPRLAFLAGDTDFHDFVTDYVLQLPSSEPDLRHLGARLPDFLGAHALGQHAPLLVDVARLELGLERAIDAPAPSAVTVAAVRAVEPERWPGLRLRLTPPTCQVESAWDLEAVARACDERGRARALACERAVIAAAAQPGAKRTLLVGRTGFNVYFRRLAPDEARALAGFAAGATLAAVCEDVRSQVPAFEPAALVAHLQRWLRDEVIGALSH